MNNSEAAIISKRSTDLTLVAVCTLIKLHLIPTTFSVQTDGEIGKPEVGTIPLILLVPAVAVEDAKKKQLEAKEQIAAQLIL